MKSSERIIIGSLYNINNKKICFCGQAISIAVTDLVITREERERCEVEFLAQANQERLQIRPIYLTRLGLTNPSQIRIRGYSELDIANQLQILLDLDNQEKDPSKRLIKPGKSVKQQLIIWITRSDEYTANILSDAALERIATIVNPDKEGGAPSSTPRKK